MLTAKNGEPASRGVTNAILLDARLQNRADAAVGVRWPALTLSTWTTRSNIAFISRVMPSDCALPSSTCQSVLQRSSLCT